MATGHLFRATAFTLEDEISRGMVGVSTFDAHIADAEAIGGTASFRFSVSKSGRNA